MYESRPGDLFVLGSSTWKISEITHDRVVVAPAPGETAARMPFWHGDGPGRPLELGRAVGAFIREVGSQSHDAAVATLQETYRLDSWAAANLAHLFAEEKETTGTLPTDRTVVVEQFRDEIGDWRTVVLTPVRRPDPRPVGPRGPPSIPRAARQRGRRPLVRRRDDLPLPGRR